MHPALRTVPLAGAVLEPFSALVSADSTLSIADMDGYDQMRWCVSEAFTLWDEGGLWNGALDCSKQDGSFLNSCVCRCDLRTSAESYISSYAKSACSTNTVDIQSGLLMYDAYCASALSTDCPGYTPVQVGVTLPTTAPATLSIWSEDGFTDARSCVTDAFVPWDSNGLWNGGLMCNKNADGQFLNQCVCRSDLLSLGESYISSAIKSGCSSNSIDIQNGISLYASYCSNAFGKKAPATVEGRTTGSSILKTSAVPSVAKTSISLSEGMTSTGSSGAKTSSKFTSMTTSGLPKPGSSAYTSTSNDPGTGTGSSASSTGSSSPSGKGLSESDKIAIGVGIGIGLPATIAAIVTCCIAMSKGVQTSSGSRRDGVL